MEKRNKGMNKKGQMMMIGILILIMALLIFIATLPAVSDVMDTSRGCSYLNCAGFVDDSATAGTTCSATNQTYDSAQDKDTLACTVLDLVIPFLILAVLAGLVMKLISGRMVEQQPDYGYQGY